MSFASTILGTQGSNLKGYWKCDETAGTSLSDSSGNGNNLTLHGTASTDYNLNQSGEQGAAIQFLGLAGYAELTSSVIGTDLAHDLTLFCLCKYSATGATVNPLAVGNDGTFYHAVLESNSGFSDHMLGYVDDNNFDFVDGGSIHDGNWHDVVFTVSGTTFKIYVDGTQIDTNTYTVATQSLNRTWIGGLNDAAGVRGTYSGYIQHAAIWNSALTGGDVTSIHAARTGGGASPTNLFFFGN